MANVKAGDLAYIVRPWAVAADLGRPVQVVRQAVYGERVQKRGGVNSRAEGSGDPLVWLCEAHGVDFPRFIADVCLRPLSGDLTGVTEPTETTLPVPVEQEA